MIAATLLMGAAVWAIKSSAIYPHGVGRTIWSMQLALLLTVGAIVYIGSTHLMGLDTVRQLIPRRGRSDA